MAQTKKLISVEEIKDRLEPVFQDEGLQLVLLFGSVVSGGPHRHSDIDIVVELEKPDLFYMIGIKQAIEEALGRRVDVVRLREKMNKVLKCRIEQDVIYV